MQAAITGDRALQSGREGGLQGERARTTKNLMAVGSSPSGASMMMDWSLTCSRNGTYRIISASTSLRQTDLLLTWKRKEASPPTEFSTETLALSTFSPRSTSAQAAAGGAG